MAVDAAYHRSWRAKNKDRVRDASRRYREKHDGAVSLASNHGIPLDEARAALASRPDACEICHRETKLYYDHDHSTKAHRGWLCNRCNVALGLVEDSELLGSALLYLERSAI